MADAESDVESDAEFEDCIDELGFEDTVNSGVSLRLPAAVLTGAAVLVEAAEVRGRFHSNGMVQLELTTEVARCRDLMAKTSPPLAGFARFLGDVQKRAIWTLFGVCHAFDNAKTVGEVEDLRRFLAEAFDPSVDSEVCTGVWRALRATLGRYAVVSRPFDDLAEGILAHPGTLAFETQDDLMLHCYRKAGVIGVIALPVLAEQASFDEGVVEAAIAMGMALQLIDLVNCIGHHRRTLGHRSVPAEVSARHGLSAEEIESNSLGKASGLERDPRWRAAMEDLLAPARPLLSRAALGGERLPGGGRIAVRAAVRMGRRVVGQIEARGYDTLHKRSKMFSLRALGDLAGALWRPSEAK
eukprot:TRINITY_DN51664_c0_g1_i1.p1 TRINITY_DN51664_c0_g1~~TRINITY_DN51664_c0_g1_i1.p1  ORF type:complete len:356 (-),score=65.64 TRINITY_DN51664_c0_g1_i1:227-1294(-)